MRYFLNIRTKDSLVTDDEGDEFSDIDRLFDHAKQVVAELEREYPSDSNDELAVIPIALEVSDENGVLIFRLRIHSCTCR